MSITAVAANQFAAWEEGMLPLPPRPTRTIASERSRNGRGRSIARLSVPQIKPSPATTASASIRAQIRPRTPPFQTKAARTKSRSGRKNGASVKNGITASKNGLLNVWLMNRKRPASMA